VFPGAVKPVNLNVMCHFILRCDSGHYNLWHFVVYKGMYL
jgi:hypothetical protein